MLKDIKPLVWVLGTSSGLKAYMISSWVSVQDSNDINDKLHIHWYLNCTDMSEHDCACLTCKTYRKNWPQAALSSAHADHFVLQVHTVDQTVHPPSSIALLGSVCLKAAAPLH